MDQGKALACILDSSHKVGCRDRSIKARAPSCSGSHTSTFSSHTSSGPGGATCAHICTICWIAPDYLAWSHGVQQHTASGSPHPRTQSSLNRLPNKLRKLRSVSAKRGRRSTRRRSHKTMRRRHGNHVSIYAIPVYMACVSPIDRARSYLVTWLVFLCYLGLV